MLLSEVIHTNTDEGPTKGRNKSHNRRGGWITGKRYVSGYMPFAGTNIKRCVPHNTTSRKEGTQDSEAVECCGRTPFDGK